MTLYCYHPLSTHGTPGLAEDIEAYDALGIPHGSNLLDIPKGSVVVPRYRMLPFGRELEQEITASGSRLINSFRQHRAVANLYSWVHLLEGLTAPAYRIEDIPRLPEGDYFLKGETNSKKADWFGSAYAANKSELMGVMRNLLNDQWVGNQELVIRPFQRYRRIGEAVNGQPIFHERRAFYFNGELLSEAHYWNVNDYGAPEPLRPEEYTRAQVAAVGAVGHIASFLVIDYAEYEDGTWGVVELNDGSLAGLSANAPLTVWGNLQRGVNS